MDRITIKDLAVSWHAGITEQERAQPQKLLLTIEMDVDTSAAAQTDDLAKTIDYFPVARRLRQWGEGRSWKLIETIAAETAELILAEFKPAGVTVEVKKFVLPDADYVSVKTNR